MGAAETEGGVSLLSRLAASADAALRLLGLPHAGAELMGERAALGASPEKTCRLLEAQDGWLALNLARGEDLELVPAWLEAELEANWDTIAAAVRERSAAELVARGREIGLAVALDQPPAASFPRTRESSLEARSALRVPRVIDLSSLWAGPLCGRLLAELGADVIKVESAQRPDGARAGSPEFFERLNGLKRQVSLDFAAQREELATLLRSADIVIEASRPRALRQLGIDAGQLCAENPRLTWISITGYGRQSETENWIAYGDDAAVAAGLSHRHWQATGERAILGDAVADPLTGIAAAVAAWSRWQAGGGGLVDVSLCGTVSAALAGFEPY